MDLKIDLKACVDRLIDDVVWGIGVNSFSLETLERTYESPSGRPFPTQEECEAVWVIIQQEIVKDKETAAAKKDFEEKVKEGFEYKGHIYQCDKDDRVMWKDGVTLMENHGMEKSNAVDINNDEWEMTLAEMKELRDLAEVTWWTLWFEYQGVKNETA